MLPGIAGIAGFASTAAAGSSTPDGALVYRSTTETFASGTNPVTYNAEAYDSASYHDLVTNPERLTIPSGVSRGRYIVNAIADPALNQFQLKNGSSFVGRAVGFANEGSGTDDFANFASAIVPVSASDYLTSEVTGATTFRETQTWAAFEPIDASLKGALVKKSGTQAIASGTTTTLTWDSEEYDTDSSHTALAATVTITIASPGVVTWTSHGLLAGSPVVFTTTGALPTGLTAGTTYYVISAGLAADSFRVATAPGGSAINTTGSQSGVHTGTNTSRLIAPSGTSLVRVSASVQSTQVAGADQAVLTMLKNGSAVIGGFAKDFHDAPSPTYISAVSGILSVAGSDYLEAQFFTTSAETVQNANDTWFQIEEIPAARKYALVYKGATQAIPSAGEWYRVLFDSEVADTDNFRTDYTSTVTITIASPGVVTWNGHGLTVGAPVVFTTSGALPTGLTAGTIYYVQSAATNTFTVSTTNGGAAINTTGSQSGTHTATVKTRVVTPAGCTKVRLSFNLKTPSVSSEINARVIKNGVSAAAVGLPRYNNNTPGTDSLNGFGAWVESTPGDYWELEFLTETTTLTLGTDVETWLCIEAE